MELRRRETGESFPLQDGMVLGRLEACSVRIEDGSISRRHAKIEAAGLGFALVDLGSSNGIFQNGARKERFELRAGDLVTLGAVAFDVVGEPAAAEEIRLDEEPAPAPSRSRTEAVAEEPEEAPSRSMEDAARERAQLRREITGDGRSRGLGDLGQQPLGVKLVVAILALAVCYGVIAGVRLLGANL